MGTLNFTDSIDLELLTTTNTGVPNNIDLSHIKNLTALVTSIIFPILTQYPNAIVTSAFRSSMVNQLVGGVTGSRHCSGRACDIVFEGQDFDAVLSWIKLNIKYDYLKTYPGNRIHIQIL